MGVRRDFSELSPHVEKRISQDYGFVLLLMIVYVLLLSANVFVDVSVVKNVANVFGVLIFVLIFLRVKVGYAFFTMPVLARFSLFIFYVGMAFNFVVNYNSTDVPDFLKFLLAPFFVVYGFSVGRDCVSLEKISRSNKFSIYLLLFIPMFMIGISYIFGESGDESGGGSLAFFSNRNNAALYFVVALSLFGAFVKAERFLFLLLAVGLLFSTVGVFVAILFSFAVVFIKKVFLFRIFLGLAFVVAAYPIWIDFPVVSRLATAMDSLAILYGGSGHISDYSFNDLVVLTDSTDLSLFFRLIHWSNLLDVWEAGPWISQVLGFGVGGSVVLSEMSLAPHNDYLRLFFECGLVSFLGFFFLQVAVISSLGRTYLAMPFIVVALYFFSENLFNNYLAMMMYFFSAGLLISSKRNG